MTSQKRAANVVHSSRRTAHPAGWDPIESTASSHVNRFHHVSTILVRIEPEEL